MSKTKFIAVTNQKGGVGKTTLSFHLAHLAAEHGSVLVIDLDTQGNISQYFSGDFAISRVTAKGSSDIFEGEALQPMPTKHPKIHLLHGHRDLGKYDSCPLAERFGFDAKPTLEALGFDFIIIDTPPSLGLRQTAPMAWADTVVIPMEPQDTAIAGFMGVLSLWPDIQALNASAKWVAVVNRSNRYADQLENIQFLQNEYGGDKVLDVLSQRACVQQAMGHDPARPVWGDNRAPRQVKDLWRSVCSKVLNLA